MRKWDRTIVFLDWDDTLLATHYFRHGGNRTDPMVIDLERILTHLVIKLVQQVDQLYIVTNADRAWVSHSAAIYLPNLYKLLFLGENEFGSVPLPRVRILSAKQMFEQHFNQDLWKSACFTECLSRHPNCEQVLSIGDSLFEQKATQHLLLLNHRPKLRTKVIKMIESPTLSLLLKQWSLIDERLESLLDLPEDQTWLLSFE